VAGLGPAHRGARLGPDVDLLWTSIQNVRIILEINMT
jgi:hypothetical protein